MTVHKQKIGNIGSDCNDYSGPCESPFYNLHGGCQSSLPDGNPVTAGGFYLMNDDGGYVFQLTNSNDPNQKIQGTIDVDGKPKSATFHGSARATSHKAGSSHAQRGVYFFDGAHIDNLSLRSDLTDPPPIAFEVSVTGSSSFSVFNVFNANNKTEQTSVKHTSEPCKEPNNMKIITQVEGCVYVQHVDENGNSQIYQGQFSAERLRIMHDNLHEFSDSNAPTCDSIE